MDLSNSVFPITGGSSGLGAATAAVELAMIAPGVPYEGDDASASQGVIINTASVAAFTGTPCATSRLSPAPFDPHLDAIAHQTNGRTRKGLGVRSPRAVCRELLIHSPQQSTVVH